MKQYQKLHISILVLLTMVAKSQSVYYGGVFPTIDHSADLTNKFGYGLYYFAAFPIINFDKPDVNKNANFLLIIV